MPEHLTDDDLTAMFSDLRSDATASIKPPGVAAARRTAVRRRRLNVGALLLVVVLGGGIVVGQGLLDRPPLPTAQLQQYAAAAFQKAELLQNDYRAVRGWEIPATPDATVTSAAYRGDLRIFASCVGSGSVVLTVLGEAARPDGPSGPADLATVQNTASEAARLRVPCDSEPVRSDVFSALGYESLIFDIAATDGALRRSGVGWLLATTLDPPTTVDDRRGSPSLAVDPAGEASSTLLPPQLPRAEDWVKISEGTSILALACNGKGTVHLQVRYSTHPEIPEAELLADRRVIHRFACSGQPQAQHLELQPGTAVVVGLTMTFESAGQSPAEVAYELVGG